MFKYPLIILISETARFILFFLRIEENTNKWLVVIRRNNHPQKISEILLKYNPNSRMQFRYFRDYMGLHFGR